jgi:excisionase family DNA binding protein
MVTYTAPTSPAPVTTDQYCGTKHAAKLLNLSVASVQSLVEKGQLQAWKTDGGHRRVSIESIQRFIQQRGVSLDNKTSPLVQVMVIDDDPLTVELIRTQIEDGEYESVEVLTYPSAMQALMDLPHIKPQILITDLRMPGVDGRQLLGTVKTNPTYSSTICVAISAMNRDEMLAEGALPAGVIYVQKPMQTVWIHGFLSAIVANGRP